jgi:D-xylose reductase
MPSTIPTFGFGTWKISRTVCADVVFDAIKLGIRHIDCACDYGNEVQVGEGINRAIQEGLVTRGELWVTSKLWNTYHAAEHVELALKKSLNDLKLDYLDLYLIHFPIAQRFVPIEVRYPPEWVYDPNAESPKIELAKVPVSETWGAMEQQQISGLTRHIGACNFNMQLLTDVLSYCRIKPYVNQIEVHPYLTQSALLEFCKQNDILVTAFSPLGSSSYVSLGMDGGEGAGVLGSPVVAGIAKKHGRSCAQVILRWHIQRGVTAIPKSSNPDHIRENFNIFDFELSNDEVRSTYCLNSENASTMISQ